MKIDSFDNLPAMPLDEALRILSMPIRKLELQSDYYKAVFHLSKYPGLRTENALMSLLQINSKEQAVVIAKRKAVEVLFQLDCRDAINLITSCLDSDDEYLVENAAWALQGFGCKELEIQKKILYLLSIHRKDRRLLIKCLSNMNSTLAVNNISKILEDSTSSNIEKGASISAIYKLIGEKKFLYKLKDHLLLKNQNDRQCAVQDIIDAELIEFLPNILKSPIAPTFRLRAINSLWPKDKLVSNNMNLFSIIESTLNDDLNNIESLVKYIEQPSLVFLIEELFSTDFSKAYFALKNLIGLDPCEITQIILNYKDRILKDYGALYFVNILFRSINNWEPKSISMIESIALECLEEKWPDYIKFKPSAILTIMKFKPIKYKSLLNKFLDQEKTLYWASRYAALMTIERNKELLSKSLISNLLDISKYDKNNFVRLKAINLYNQFFI